MSVSVYFNNQEAIREQFLVEDLIIESIKNHGIDIYYLPRESRSSVDELYGDDPVKTYQKSYPMEMYLETFNDFEGNQQFFSKFGLQIEKSARFAVARRTFQQYVPTELRNTPKEGDLIWMPQQLKLMEIKQVDQEKNFFQLGKIQPYMFGLNIETFRYNGEYFDTGIYEIDKIANDNANSIEYNLNPGGVGTFIEYEQVYQGASLSTATATGYVSGWDFPSRKIKIRNIKGTFANGLGITGVNSLAFWVINNGDPMNNASELFDDNAIIEAEADNILNWDELNPFGSPDEQ